MGRFGARTPKPHRVWSNDGDLITLLCRRAGYMSREQQNACEGRTVKKYVDVKGVKRHVGLKDELRASQNFGNNQQLPGVSYRRLSCWHTGINLTWSLETKSSTYQSADSFEAELPSWQFILEYQSLLQPIIWEVPLLHSSFSNLFNWQNSFSFDNHSGHPRAFTRQFGQFVAEMFEERRNVFGLASSYFLVSPQLICNFF